jgi:hypothetical protein
MSERESGAVLRTGAVVPPIQVSPLLEPGYAIISFRDQSGGHDHEKVCFDALGGYVANLLDQSRRSPPPA